MTNTLKMISIKNWDLGKMAINKFSGWFYVKQPGKWRFWGSYDDECSLWIDGFDALIDGSYNGKKIGERDFELAKGWHHFDFRICDFALDCGPWDPEQGAALQYQIDGGPRLAFDESNLRLRASLSLPNTEYGFIGGLLELKNGSQLSNRSVRTDLPCKITGTLKGSGTMDGPFAFSTNGVWEVSGNGDSLTNIVHFEGNNRCPDTLADLRHIKAVFTERPRLNTYELSDPLGIGKDLKDGSGILDEVEVVATDPAGEKQYSFSAAIRDNKLILINHAPPGLTLFFE